MASKRSKSDLLESPPSASPSEHSSDEGEESSSEESTPMPKPAAQKPQSSASGDSGSESESESEPEEEALVSVSQPVVKPQTSKVVDQPATKKPVSKPAPAPNAPTPAVAKRPAESKSGNKESKKAKQAAEGGKGDGTVEKSTPRVWGEDDEIAILKGAIEYEEKVGLLPFSDMEAFHSFIKKSLSAEASRSQLYEKVRRLKKKYWDNVEKLKKDANVSSSWKPHEKKIFDLSKNIWRSEGNGLQSPKVEKVKSAAKTKKNDHQSGSKPVASLPPKMLEMTPTPVVDGAKNVEDMEAEKNLPPPLMVCGSGDMQIYVMEKGLDLIKGPQRAELEERLSNLHKAELELFAKRTKLIHDQTNLLLAAKK